MKQNQVCCMYKSEQVYYLKKKQTAFSQMATETKFLLRVYSADSLHYIVNLKYQPLNHRSFTT